MRSLPPRKFRKPNAFPTPLSDKDVLRYLEEHRTFVTELHKMLGDVSALIEHLRLSQHRTKDLQ